ncbi:hypothetical protein GW17_00041050 [Ensete ventricosum]|nr:hypothetical protein GW17_00041050 [Ensete ventricosum]
MLILQEEPLTHIRPYCCLHPQRAKAKRIVQEMQETQIIRPRPSLAMTLYLQKFYLFVSRYKRFLKCHIQLNQLWLLKQHSQISGYFHDFSKEWTIMLKVFPDDDHRSTTHDRKKIESLQRQYQHRICDIKPYWMEIKILKEQEEGINMSTIYRILTTTMPSTSMLALPDRDNVFAIGAYISRIGIGTTLMQDGRLLICTEALPTFHTIKDDSAQIHPPGIPTDGRFKFN